MGQGRPKKHVNADQAAEARRERNRRYYIRKRQAQAPPEVFFHAPALPGVPTITRPDLGLRISADVPIPQDPLLQPEESPKDEDGYRPPCPPAPPAAADEAAAAAGSQLPASDKEREDERTEYEQRILAQMRDTEARAAGILLEMQAGTTQARTSGEQRWVPEPLGNRERPAEHAASWSQAVESGKLAATKSAPATDPRSMRRPSTPTLARVANASTKALNSPQTPCQRSSLSSVPSSTRDGRRKTFPAQSNTLLSWVKPTSRQSSEGSNTPLQPTQPPPIHSTPPTLPPSPSCGTSRPLQLPNSSHTQPAAQGTPATTSPSPFVRLQNDDVPSPGGARAAPAAQPTPPTPPTERTAYKLAKQLRNFQGCTHEQHSAADRLHHEHHQRPDVHSACSSLHEITTLLCGDYAGGPPLPDVLGSPRLMEPADVRGVDCRSAFEGMRTAGLSNDVRTGSENLPRNLCLSQRHSSSNKNRAAKTTFDIDSLCCFPTSLRVARQGINWFPKSHPFLNLSGDIHFGLKVPTYTHRGDLAEKYVPLHKIPHYCFGSVLGMESLFIYIFFPALHAEREHGPSTYLSSQDQQLWYDAVLSPALKKTIGCSNILQHYPASAHVASLDSTALSAETLARKESSREQLLRHALQPQYLDPLWDCILRSIVENPGLSQFQGATLFMHAKNTKLEYMDASPTAAYGRWERVWSEVTDPQFYSKDRTFVDLGKQVTSEDSALPYDLVPDEHEAEVFLWRRCCLEAYARTREARNADGSQAKGNPRRTTYPWATLRDTMGQTLFASPHRKESADGLIYSQFYGLIKTPFDTSKAYVFGNESLENLALDPGYVRSLQQEGGGISFSEAACRFAYLHGKKRAHTNLTDSRWKSYGVREEHRISLSMMEDICEQWHEWDLYDDSIDDVSSPLPYYVVPTQELLGFLYAQINKYCLLFEHTLAHAARTYSLPETMVMVVALRALRFCYGSNLIQRESLLYKDRWEQTGRRSIVVKEGLGMRETMERCGVGWFLPKFHWASWRLAPPHGDNMLVGNLLMHAEYKRRWQAVKDLRDVYVRFAQAEGWYDQYNVDCDSGRLGKWLEYLHVLNLEQFDADVWKAMLAANKRSPELTPEAIRQDGDVDYCYRGMKRMFLVDGAASPPHLVTGNKMRFERVVDLLNFLFLWDDKEERLGWGHKPYRVILQKSFELIQQRLGYRKADRWLDEFFHLVRLTHWILPYPSSTAFITATKTSRAQGLRRRMMWFSAVYTHPDKVALPFRSMPCTLHRVLQNAQRQLVGEGRRSERPPWGTSQLISACRAQGVLIHGLEEGVEHWIVGKRSIGIKGFMPVWERARPPRLKMLGQIRGKSLEELDKLMIGFIQEGGGELEDTNTKGDRSDCEEGSVGSSQPAPLRRSIREVFMRQVSGNIGGADDDDGSGSELVTGSSSSLFVPSVRSTSSPTRLGD